jgi:hypothetical protein
VHLLGKIDHQLCFWPWNQHSRAHCQDEVSPVCTACQVLERHPAQEVRASETSNRRLFSQSLSNRPSGKCCMSAELQALCRYFMLVRWMCKLMQGFGSVISDLEGNFKPTPVLVSMTAELLTNACTASFELRACHEFFCARGHSAQTGQSSCARSVRAAQTAMPGAASTLFWQGCRLGPPQNPQQNRPRASSALPDVAKQT